MSHHIGLQVLRAKIRGFQASGTTISSRISRSEKDHKNKLWDAKRRLGTHCRYHLVAYGLLRGVPYRQIERCATNNKLDPRLLLDVMLLHADWKQRRELDLTMVENLMQNAVPVTATVGAVHAPASVLSSQETDSLHVKEA